SRAIEIDPDHADAALRLGSVLLTAGRIPEALAQLEAAAAGKAGRAASSLRLFAFNCSDRAAAGEIWQAHRAFGQSLEESVVPLPPPERDRDPDRLLRVGYVSGDFRQHACAFFIEPLLAAHDPAAVEVFCYATVKEADAVTDRLRGHARGWREVAGLTDAELAALIRTDAIDVLVDLSGHTAGNRLGVFALRPAPVQATWLGYPNTTGLVRIDYRLTDGQTDPPGAADALHSERLERLERIFLCYRPPAWVPEVSPLPAGDTGVVTFGSFNAARKLSAAALAAWAEILRALPESRLLMKNKALADELVRVRIRTLFARHGIAPERVGLYPFAQDPADAITAYGAVDVALDPFPYAGTTTTCESLWMGVPVVTLEGDRHAARVGGSILRCLGLEAECVAATPEEYVAKAVALARDRARLAALRRELRSRMAASPLRDEAGFARAVEAAYRAMWRRWCAATG
ncbi:MAG: hypothetical protein IRY94_06330, partial [Rhodospirillaceae bacterium]|nr:hypothetical protein [Rhodospirillaceae bacterium]